MPPLKLLMVAALEAKLIAELALVTVPLLFHVLPLRVPLVKAVAPLVLSAPVPVRVPPDHANVPLTFSAPVPPSVPAAIVSPPPSV